MNQFQMILLSLLYLLCGLFYTFIYVQVYRPEAADAALGFAIVLWPLYLIIDIATQLAKGIGSGVRPLLARLRK